MIDTTSVALQGLVSYEIYRTHGLCVVAPLVVRQTARTAGGVTRTIAKAGGNATVANA